MKKMRVTKDDEIKQAYFKWLYYLVEIGGPDNYNGRKDLAWLLHNIVFYDFIPNDDNRSEDGKKLRERFFDTTLIGDCNCLDGQCSMLEMLIALADRMDFILGQIGGGNKTNKWFWMLIDNLGLEIPLEDDGIEERQRKHYDNQKKVGVMLARKYSSKGVGGLFPLRRAKEDQRRVEIWYQLMAYLNENSLR